MNDAQASANERPDDAIQPETAPVRDGEQLDWAALNAYLRACLPDLAGDLSVRQFPNGSANLTYLIRVGATKLVVRRPPFGEIATGAHDMRREYRALSGLHRVYDRAPRPLLHCDDETVIGSEFLVMEYRPGIVVWDRIPEQLARHDQVGQRIGRAVVDALIDLHHVDIAAAGLSDLGRPARFLERQVAGWARRWHAVADIGTHPEMDRLADQIGTSQPQTLRHTVLHNDFKIDNCQFAPDNPDRVVSVFDWDMATLGDPLVDLGTLLNYWPGTGTDDVDTALAIPGLDQLGLPTPEEITERYARGTGHDVHGLAWYEAYGCWKTAVILRQLYVRHLRGETTDSRMATRAAHIDGLAKRALRLLDTI